MPKIYDLTNYIVHNNAACEFSETTLNLRTPPETWSYAVEFPRKAPIPANSVIRARVNVRQGAVGVGILRENGTDFIKETQFAIEKEWQEVALEIPAEVAAGSLMIRNVAFSGYSEAVVELLPTEIGTPKALNRLELDASALCRFKPWAGVVPAGYWADWTGLITRADVWKFPEDQMAIFNTTRHEAHTVAINGEHVIDWVPLADAVNYSGDTFRMAALGAGWGRWLAAGGALAKQTGRMSFLVGVEADAQHFSWMTRHFEENGFSPSQYKLIEAAASALPGTCRFAVGDPQAWYGQSMLKDEDRTTLSRTVRAVTIQDVLQETSPLDYLHMDIQGAELDVLLSHPSLLNSQVRLINIGTHSVEIESGLRKLFNRLEWRAVYDVKLGSSMLVCVGDEEHIVNFEDGAQIWRNPRLRG